MVAFDVAYPVTAVPVAGLLLNCELDDDSDDCEDSEEVDDDDEECDETLDDE